VADKPLRSLPRRVRRQGVFLLVVLGQLMACEGVRAQRDPPVPAGVLARLGSTRLRHAETVKDLAFLPDGKTLVAADPGSIRLWDTATGREVRRLGNGNVHSISLSADGKRLAASPQTSGPFRVWDVPTGRLVRTIDGPDWSTVVLSPDSKRLASIGANTRRSGLDSVVHVWDVATGRKAHTLDRHTGIVWSLAFSPDGTRLYSGSADKTIRTWDVASGREVGRIDGHHGRVCLLAVSPDGKRLASVGMHYDKYSPDRRWWRTFNRVSLWDTRAHKKVTDIVGPAIEIDRWGFPSDGFHAIAFTPDSKTLVTTGVRNALRLWDVTTGKERRQIRLPGTTAHALAISPDGRTLAAGDNVLHLWDVQTGRELLPQPGHQAALTAVALAGDGRTIATAGHDRTVRLWERSTGREVRCLECGGVLYLGFSAGARQLVTSGADRTTRVWEVATGRELRRFAGVDSNLGIRWALAPDGKTVAQAVRFETVGLWDVATGKLVRELPEEMVMGVGFSPDSRTLLLCNGLKNVHLYTAATGKHLSGFTTTPPRQHRSYQDVVFSPDGRWVALWSSRYEPPRSRVRVHLFDTATGRQVHAFEDLGRALAFSADSRLLACRGTDDDRHVNLVEVATGKRVRQFDGHQGRVQGLAFSGDGRMLVTAGADAVALVWDLTGLAGQEVRLSARQCEQKWTDLADADPARAYQAGWELTATARGLQLLQKRLRPAAAVAAEQVARWIRELDADNFEVRSAATAALEKLGRRAEAPLRQAQKGSPGLEPRRRLERLLKRLEREVLSPEQLRSLRAIAALEAVGTPEARRLLEGVAGGAAGAVRTREARAALDRLAVRGK
jgi:WD40 repeat protein